MGPKIMGNELISTLRQKTRQGGSVSGGSGRRE